MKNKKIIRTLAATLAAVLCFAAFSTTAFAGGADPDPAPLPEETGTPTTGGIELDTEDGEGGSHTSGTTETSEDAENTEDSEAPCHAAGYGRRSGGAGPPDPCQAGHHDRRRL